MSSSASVLPPVNRRCIESPVGGAVLGKSGARGGRWAVAHPAVLVGDPSNRLRQWLRLLEGGGEQAAGESGASTASWGERRPGWSVANVGTGDGSRPVGA
jgi:hypothetical protein